METDVRPTLPPPMPPAPPAPIDPAMQERLARLTASRTPRSVPATTGRTTAPAQRTRKRHAAKGSRTAAVLMSITTAAGLSVYFQHAAAAASPGTTNTVSGVATATGTAATATATGAATAPTSATASTSSTLADGTYAGATDTNKWGPVQVQITVAGGKITQVVALQTPTADHRSVSINARATPTLASEALSAQSATIDTVSGATYTSDSYKVSLQSAIDLARSTASKTTTTP